MPKPATHKAQPPSESDRDRGVVRAAKVIPAMGTSRAIQEPPRDPKASLCAGRCGHCDVHPCQLHTSI